MMSRSATWMACLLVSAIALQAESPEKCATCKGGTVACPSCHGKAKDAVPCANCSGTGKLTCPQCEGKGGWKAKEEVPAHDLRGIHHNCKGCKNGVDCKFCIQGKVACLACKGTGKAPRTCLACGQTGRLKCPACSAYASASPCPACNGKGEGKCGVCGGTGGFLSPCSACGGFGAAPCADCAAAGHLPCPGCGGTGRESTGTCETCHGTGVEKHDACGGKGSIPCASCLGKGMTEAACWLCGGSKTRPCLRCLKSQAWFAAVPDSEVRLWVLPLADFEPEVPALVRSCLGEARQGWRLFVDARYAKPDDAGATPADWEIVRIDSDAMETKMGAILPSDSFAERTPFDSALARMEATSRRFHSPASVAVGPGRVSTAVVWGVEPPAGMASRLIALHAKLGTRVELEQKAATGDDWVRLLLDAQ